MQALLRLKYLTQRFHKKVRLKRHNHSYREYARITKIDDSALEFEFMRASDVTEHFKELKKAAQTAT